MKKSIVVTTIVISLSCLGSVLADGPARNIDPHRNPNLAAAQSDIVAAYEKIDKSQRETRDELGGHGQKAKELLLEADAELRRAANYYNEKH